MTRSRRYVVVSTANHTSAAKALTQVRGVNMGAVAALGHSSDSRRRAVVPLSTL